MIQISRPYIGLQELINTYHVMLTGRLSAAKYVQALEENFSKTFDIPYSLAVSNGTAALHLALMALGVGKGDEVIVTPFTFIATANAILMVGAVPVFVDVDFDTLCISAKCIKNAVTKKTKAVITVNIYGNPCDYDEIRSSIPGHVFVVEDAAQSVGAIYKNRYSGTLGDVATFSLYATKNIMSGEGGIVTTNLPEVHEKIHMLRQHGMRKNGNYKYEELGYNYRLSDIQAAIAVAQLSKHRSIFDKRRLIAKKYQAGLGNIKGIRILKQTEKSMSARHQFPIIIEKNARLDRDGLKNKLQERGIMTAIYYPEPLYKAEHLAKMSVVAKCPVTEAASESILCLPIYPALADDDQCYIIDTINQLLR